MSTKLNQVVAIEKGAKAQANDAITQAYHVIQKPDLFAGVERTYDPQDEDGEQFPPESTKVQYRAEDLLKNTGEAWTRLLDVTATKDWANSHATADVKVNGTTVLAQVPVTYLIWLEKQLVDMHTMVSKLPVLDPSFEWDVSITGDWATPSVKTHKTKKVPRNHVMAEATKEHPAQVSMYTEDVLVGYWNTIRYSGAIPQARQNEFLRRVEDLQRAVKFAREEANGTDVTDIKVGGLIFDYLLT